ncbi:hypothetical protein ABT263_20730 [Kitasatospora sp. NPDC001603]|uniref:hypothetical protein n=1 Tax=Kitasatospora sp. NPDC001603 TaxID=3154388 RepID=UPI003331E4B4
MTDTASGPRANWRRAPLVSTRVTGLGLLFVLPLRVLAQLAAEPCPGPGGCPATEAQLLLSDRLLLATAALLVVQWPVAYLLRPARVWAALAPMAALLSVVAAIFTINPGT